MRKDEVFSLEAASRLGRLAVARTASGRHFTLNPPDGVWAPSDLEVRSQIDRHARRYGGATRDSKTGRAIWSDPDIAEAYLARVWLPEEPPLPTAGNAWSYWPTPPAVARMMIDQIAVDSLPECAWILEPSAGVGHLVAPLWDTLVAEERTDVAVDAVECQWDRAAFLRTRLGGGDRNIVVQTTDFLEWTAPRRYDAVLMNPPFTTPGNKAAYIAHIRRAWEWVAPGGVLVAVAPAGFLFGTAKAQVAFREWVESYGWTEILADDAMAPAGTHVQTVLIVMRRPPATGTLQTEEEQSGAVASAITAIVERAPDLEPEPEPETVLALTFRHALREDQDNARALREQEMAESVARVDAAYTPPAITGDPIVDGAAARAGICAALGVAEDARLPPAWLAEQSMSRGLDLWPYRACTPVKNALQRLWQKAALKDGGTARYEATAPALPPQAAAPPPITDADRQAIEIAGLRYQMRQCAPGSPARGRAMDALALALAGPRGATTKGKKGSVRR